MFEWHNRLGEQSLQGIARLTMTELERVDREVMEGRLNELRTRHRDLDGAIDALVHKGIYDYLQLQRLKKQKLQLKDQIATLENALVPDIIA